MQDENKDGGQHNAPVNWLIKHIAPDDHITCK